MRAGRGRWRVGRWWLYIDTRLMTVGRAADHTSVVYSLLGLVAEHHRPDGYAERVAVANRAALIGQWQRLRNGIWMRSEWAVEQLPDDTVESWQARRWRYTQVRYEAVAADARARRKDAPSLDELRLRAPTGIPTTVYTR